MLRLHSNVTREVTPIKYGLLEQSDGLLTEKVSGYPLPEFTGFDTVFIKIKGGSPVDFLLII